MATGKTELINFVATEAKLIKADLQRAVEAVLEGIKDALQGEKRLD